MLSACYKLGTRGGHRDHDENPKTPLEVLSRNQQNATMILSHEYVITWRPAQSLQLPLEDERCSVSIKKKNNSEFPHTGKAGVGIENGKSDDHSPSWWR